ncbi:MAG: M50 family metallopeptidase [Acidimicrobiia bacterium]|nr:M50 family metallopeptidase [Acidimicrobiia bacterium]
MRDPLETTKINGRKVLFVTTVIVLLVTVWAVLQPQLVGTIVLILSLPTIIILHEAGHFVMAKRSGMKVTEFFVGFGPKIWSVRRGKPEYGVKAVLLGGYVRIIGMNNLEEVEPEDEPRAYRNQSFHDRIGVAVAGSAVHFMLALLLIFILLVSIGLITDTTAVGTVGEGTAAEESGLEPDDVILSIDDVQIETFDELRDYVRPRPEQELVVTVERDGEVIDIPVVPKRSDDEGEEVGLIGVTPALETDRVAPVPAVRETFVVFGRTAQQSVEALGRLFSPAGIVNYVDTVFSGGEDSQGEQSQERFVSPLGFGRLANQAVATGWLAVLGLLVSINVFVGIFNLIPLLPFDGGHVAIACYEKIASTIKGRPVQADVAKLLPITSAVMVVLGFIFFSSLFLDASNPLQNPF